ncbi:pyridoxamine 5'-phosphate oxidase family protein [Oxalobacteraceae bacterium OM1]|nr:pyridoxamine 5'-phosphate oxidase family protein [Oxalobacteraceae bacterium OM1]
MTPEPILDAEHAAFLQMGVSMSFATCDAQHIPVAVRAVGCRVAADRRRVALFVSSRQAGRALDCLRERGVIAVVFSHPPTHRTVQLKGKDAAVEGLQPGDLELMAGQQAAFIELLAPMGYAPEVVSRLFMLPPADLVAVAFTPIAAYSQTPGPRAGEPLRSAA